MEFWFVRNFVTTARMSVKGKMIIYFSGKLLAVQSEGDFKGNLIEALHKAANDSKKNFALFEKAVKQRLE